MKERVYLRLILCSLCLFILPGAYGQTVSLDTNLQQTALNKANADYVRAIGQQLPLYNGPEYYLYNPAEFRGSAYFMDMTFTPGAVYYDGVEYKGVQLLYDLYKDQLASLLTDQSSKFLLLNDRVQNFDLLGHHFININADTLTNNTLIKTGYYDQLYLGRSQVLSKRYKTVQNYNSTTGAQEAYSYFTNTKEDFFVRKDNVYYKVASQGALLDILKDKKKQLKEYIKANKIKFNTDPGHAMVSIVTYYDHMIN